MSMLSRVSFFFVSYPARIYTRRLFLAPGIMPRTIHACIVSFHTRSEKDVRVFLIYTANSIL